MLVAGIDEAGRGCLAGPVVAAAVILPAKAIISGLTDSKKVSSSMRELLALEIKARCICWSIGLAWPAEIDRINVLQATMQAMRRAVRCLAREPDRLLVDGNHQIPSTIPQKCITGGDLSQPCISAASILAKTFRDKLMGKLDLRYPGYGLSRHKGYGTKEHLLAFQNLGPSPVHRKSFKGVVQTSREVFPWLPII